MSSPNILILYTDQHRADAVGASGNPHIKTPHLDKLAGRGTLFRSCFVQNPVCMPSRASFLTGRYPSATGISEMGFPMPEDIPNIATYFSRSGYETANIGKLHFLPHGNRDHTHIHPSYDFNHLEISDEPGVYPDSYRAWVASKDPNQLPFLSVGLPPARRDWLNVMNEDDPVEHPNRGNDIEARNDFIGAQAFMGDDAFTHSAFVGQRTIDYIESRADSAAPFMAIAGFYSPHAPWVVPQKFLDLYNPETLPLPKSHGDLPESQVLSASHGYYAMVSEVDHWCGEILATLETTGKANNTIVVFTSDHGEWLGHHGRFGKGYPADDSVSNVPLLISAPGIPGRAESETAIVEALDVLPTILELSGIPVSTELQGRSLVHLIRGEADSEDAPRSALTESSQWRCLRTETHRYLCHTDGSERLYEVQKGNDYELCIDPTDTTQQAVLAALRKTMLQRVLKSHRCKKPVWPY